MNKKFIVYEIEEKNISMGSRFKVETSILTELFPGREFDSLQLAESELQEAMIESPEDTRNGIFTILPVYKSTL